MPYITPAVPPKVDQTDYLSWGPGNAALHNLAFRVTDLLRRGQPGTIAVPELGVSVPVDVYPRVAIIYSDRPGTAQYIASVLVDTLVDAERQKPAARRAGVGDLAQRLGPAIAEMLDNAGDPAGCQVAFEDSFQRWSDLASAMQAPTSVSATGWCSKAAAIARGCAVSAVCRSTVDRRGRMQIEEASAPAAGDLRPAVTTSGPPAPPPTRAQIEAEVRAKMARQGETLTSLEQAAELKELAAYMSALGTARLWLTMALELPPNASDQVVFDALGRMGITGEEAIDWFVGCNADAECFRIRMNAALGEADQRRRDHRAAALLGACTLGAGLLVYLALRRR